MSRPSALPYVHVCVCLCVCACAHFRDRSSGKRHLQVVKPGGPDGVEPVHHFLREQKTTVLLYYYFSIITGEEGGLHGRDGAFSLVVGLSETFRCD